MATHKKQKTKQSQRLIKVLKITSYSLAWLIIWSIVAFGMALVSLIIAIPTIDQANFTSRSASNLVLTIILVIAAVFFLAVWLLRNRKSLFMRTSRIVLLVCTILGLLVGVPASLLGAWEPEYSKDASTVNTQQVDTDDTQENARRWQYMLCSDGSSRYYTDEQFKNPQVGFTNDSEDACAANGNGVKTSLADEPPKATSQQPSATTSNTYQEYADKQKKDSECYSKWNTHYTAPKSQLGSKPSTAHIIHYIGTDQYESVVAEYNAKARAWNAALKQYEQNYKNATVGMGCDTSHLFSGYDYDKVNEYNY